MKNLQVAFIVVMLGLGAAAVASSKAVADNDPNRPTDLIAADLGVPEASFIACFAEVEPDAGFAPSGARQRANKAILLPCLQEANPAITNARLDAVMDSYRPEGPIRR